MSYAWLPYALHYHHMYKYIEYIDGLDPESWTKTFYGINSSDFNDQLFDYSPDDWMEPGDETSSLVLAKERMLRKVVG